MTKNAKLKLLLLFLMILSGCSSKPYVVERSENNLTASHNQVYVVSHGWHTGFVIPAADIQAVVPELKKRFPIAQNIEFGWGDKGFYQSTEIGLGLILQAVFWPTESVVHAVAIPRDVRGFFHESEIGSVCLDDDDYSALLRFISNSFARNHLGNIQPQRHGIYGNSQFYTGVGDYYLMNTCNKWTAKGLSSAGLNIAPMFKLTSESIIDYLRGQDSISTQSCAGLD